MTITVKNIYKTKTTYDKEIFDEIISNVNFELERIISSGQMTQEGKWLIDDRNEWVILLSGSAALLFDGETKPVILNPGDYLLIPANTKHRVEWTDSQIKSVWLALHF